MKTKKSFVFLLSVFLLSSLLFCNGKEEGAAVAGKSVDNVNPAGVFPIVKEKITIKVQVNKDANIEDLSTNLATLAMEEKTNIHLEMEVTTADNRADKVKLMLASGDYPEAFLNGNFNNNDIMDYGVRQQIFIPIDGLIDEYGQRIKEVDQSEYSFLSHLYTPDGHVYGLPSINECYHCSVAQKAWINSTWLDNLGLDMPTNTDELYEVLKAFKEEDANGNGDKDDEIAFTGQVMKGAWHGPAENFLMNPFAMSWENGVNGSNYFYVKDDKSLGYSPIDEGWKDGLKYMAKLYSEGLIDPMSFSQTNEQLKTVANRSGDNILGAFTFGHLQGLPHLSDSEPDGHFHDYDVLPPIAGPDGTVNVPYYKTAVSGARFTITDKCENPEAMLRWVDYAWTTEGTMTLQWGPQGTMWDYAKPGQLDLEGEQAIWEHVMTCEGGEIHNNSWRQEGPDCRTFEGWRARWANDQDDSKETGYELFLYKRSVPYVEEIPEPEYQWVEPFIPSDKVTEAARLRATIQEFVDMSRVQFIVGEKDINSSDWDNYVDQLNKMGLEKYIAIYGDAWNAKIGR